MNDWVTVRKGSTDLHLSYGHSFTNNLFGYEAQIRSKPSFEIRLDLTPNLKTRNKQTNTYMDARELADGEIADLQLLQIVHDDRIMDAIARSLHHLRGERPASWTLTLRLGEDWSFVVTPEFRAPSLFLHVQGLAAKNA